MAKKKPTTSKKKVKTRNVQLSDGSVIKANNNNARRVKSAGKSVPNTPTVDEEGLPEPTDALASLKYPPPKKNPIFRQSWGRFIENVTSRENFKPGHLSTLEILCDLYAELEALNKFLRMNGMSFEVIMVNGKSRRMYPEVAQRDKVRAQIQQYSRFLDLFPKKDKSSRGMDPGEDSEWD